ncbi:MAG: hypothetical protein ABI330_02235 [Caldimonas sp.]
MAGDGRDARRRLARRFQAQHLRHWGFWLFILSNVLWIAWGWQSKSYALILLQVGLFVMNVRGMRENPESGEGR